jgi:hypothetical protein
MYVVPAALAIDVTALCGLDVETRSCSEQHTEQIGADMNSIYSIAA